MESETPQASSPSLCQRSERTNWEDVPTTRSKNSVEDGRHSQKPTSEGEAGHAKEQEEGRDLQDTMQGLRLCVH